MKRILALILFGLFLLLPLYAEGEDPVDEVEQGEEQEQGLEQDGTSPQAETPTEPEKTEQMDETVQEVEAEQAGGSEEGEENMQAPVSEGGLPEMFVVMDEDGALISSSGAGNKIGLSSMETLLLMAALDEKYGQSGDMGILKVGADFESTYGAGLDIMAGEEFKAQDLYTALFLKSPDDAALLFALRDFGGEEPCLSALSELAAKIGLSSTSIGDLYGEASTSTLYDIAKLFLYNYENSARFKEASSLKTLNIEGTDTTAGRQLNSSSALVLDTGMTVLYQGEERGVFEKAIVAGKTAYAYDGSYIMLSLLNVHGRPLVFLSSGNQLPEEAYLRHKLLQDKIAEGYELVKYLKAGSTVKAFRGEGEERQALEMSPKGDVFLFLPKNYDVKAKLENRYQSDAQGASQIAIYKEGALFKTVPASGSAVEEGESYLGEVRAVEDEKQVKDKAFDIVIIVLKILLIFFLWLLVVILNRWRIRRHKRRLREKNRRLKG